MKLSDFKRMKHQGTFEDDRFAPPKRYERYTDKDGASFEVDEIGGKYRTLPDNDKEKPEAPGPWTDIEPEAT